MTRKAVFFAFLACLLFFSTVQAAGRSKVHFFVIPASAPAQDVAAFNEFLSRTAGGFTAMPSQGGYLDPKGDILIEKNVSYIVAADRDISKEIAAFIKEKLKEQEAFILVWEVERPR